MLVSFLVKPVSHCGELGLRLYYEYWRVITRQTIREFAVISYDCDMNATSARVLLDISTRCVRISPNKHEFTRHLYDLCTTSSRQTETFLQEYTTACCDVCTTFARLMTSYARVRMARDDFWYKYPLNCT